MRYTQEEAGSEVKREIEGRKEVTRQEGGRKKWEVRRGEDRRCSQQLNFILTGSNNTMLMKSAITFVK